MRDFELDLQKENMVDVASDSPKNVYACVCVYIHTRIKLGRYTGTYRNQGDDLCFKFHKLSATHFQNCSRIQ